MRAAVFLLLAACGSGFEHTEIRVSGNCEMCKEKIEAAIKTSSVKRASWDPEKGILEVDFDRNSISANQIRERIARAGYDTDSLKADSAAYSQLHECCRYR
jgi:Cu(I)/Ag(I) efflux system membrane fusion protein